MSIKVDLQIKLLSKLKLAITELMKIYADGNKTFTKEPCDNCLDTELSTPHISDCPAVLTHVQNLAIISWVLFCCGIYMIYQKFLPKSNLNGKVLTSFSVWVAYLVKNWYCKSKFLHFNVAIFYTQSKKNNFNIIFNMHFLCNKSTGVYF